MHWTLYNMLILSWLKKYDDNCGCTQLSKPLSVRQSNLADSKCWNYFSICLKGHASNLKRFQNCYSRFVTLYTLPRCRGFSHSGMIFSIYEVGGVAFIRVVGLFTSPREVNKPTTQMTAGRSTPHMLKATPQRNLFS